MNNDERRDEIEVWRVRRIVEKTSLITLDGVIIAKFQRRMIECHWKYLQLFIGVTEVLNYTAFELTHAKLSLLLFSMTERNHRKFTSTIRPFIQMMTVEVFKVISLNSRF